MKIIIAPDSFKESLDAFRVAEALGKGLSKAFPRAELDLMPLADGGEGTRAVIARQLGLQEACVPVTGPYGEVVSFPYSIGGGTALVEVAELIGLGLIPMNKRDPLKIETRGLGEGILHLAKQGVTNLYVGIGGTASHDGGIGLAAGLGYRFLDGAGRELAPIGANLGLVAQVVEPLARPWEQMDICLLTDVQNPLVGRTGATFTFAGQKGLAENAFESCDRDLEHFYRLVNRDMLLYPGAGAGGGLAAGFLTFTNARLSQGIETILSMLSFEERVRDADLVIVGEGRLDWQSLSGKAPMGVARRTPSGVPVLAVCGMLDAVLPVENILGAYAIMDWAASKEDAMKHAADYLERIGEGMKKDPLVQGLAE